MAPVVLVDDRWLLDVAQGFVPGDPDVTDYGALGAAVGRHRHTVMDRFVYAEPHHRAAALLHCLARVPALEHSNELFAAMVAHAYLQASGLQVKTTTDDAVELVARTAAGQVTIRDIATALQTWTG